MVSRSKPDYTFGELEGIDDLAALGIEIQDDAPAEQEQPGRDRFPGNGPVDVPARDPDKARKLRETLARWQTQQENELVEVNPDAVERDRAVAAEHAPELVAEYNAVMVRNENIPGRINERLAGLSKGLPQAKLGKYGKRAVWWAQVDPLTHRWIVPAKEEHGVAAGDLVVGEFNGVLRAGVVDKPEDIPGGMLLDAGSDQALGNSVGRVLQRFDEPYRELKRRHDSGDLRREWEAKEAVSGHGLPERSAAPAASESMTETVSHESAEIAQATVRDPDTGETVTLTAAKEGDGPTVVTAKSEGEAGPLMAATEAAMEDVAERSAAPDHAPADEPTMYTEEIEGMATRMTADGRLQKKGDISSVAQQRLLAELVAANPDLATHLGMPRKDGMVDIHWTALSRADASKLVGIFGMADDYVAKPYDGEGANTPASAESPATEGQGFEPLPEGYDLSAYGFGDSDAGPEAEGDAPEPAPEPDKYELANQHGEMLADQSGLERDSDEWRSVASEGYNAYLDDLEGITGPKMTWTKRLIVPTESGYAVVEPAPVESPATEGQGFEPLPEGYDLSAYGFGDPDAAPEATSASENDNRYLDENGEIPADKQERLLELIAEHGLGQMSELPDDALLDAMRSAQSAKDSKDTSVEDRRLLSDLMNTATMVWRGRRGSEQTQGATEPEDDAPTAAGTDDAEPEPPPIADGGGERVVVPISDHDGKQLAAFEGYKISDNFAVHREAIGNAGGGFTPGELWSITYIPTGDLLLTSKSNLKDTMAFASRIVPLIDRDNADDARAAITPDIKSAINAISNRQNNLNKALQHLDQAEKRPAADIPPPSDIAQTDVDVDVSDPQTRQQWAAGILGDQWFERGLAARQAQYSGNLITQVESGMDAPWANRQEIARQYIESLIGPPDVAKGEKYSLKKQRELHQKLQALAAEGQEAAAAPDESPESPDSDEPEPETGDTMPASESSAEASEPEPEAPPLAPVLADAEPGPAEPPPVITPTIGKGPPEPPKVASVSRNDTAEQLQQKWKQADQSIDAYAKSYGIAGIPDDAARLVLRPDGSVGVERLRVTPQGSAYRTPARPASGSGGGDGGGGGSSSSKPSAPAIGLRKSWDRMSLAEKQSVIDVINDALARRALLSSALVTMTCSPTGDLALSQGQKMATIVGSCAPRSTPVSPRQSLQAHPWLSKHEMATLGGGQRKSGQSQKGKKSNSRR